MFSEVSVSHYVQRRGGGGQGVGYLWSNVLLGVGYRGVGHLWAKTTKAGGMHPTGMLSCFLIELIISNLF